MRNRWTEDELAAAVSAYAEMHYKERNAQSFIKSDYYKNLALRFGRSEKAYEYRMQNISYIYDLMGRKWISGLKPAKNIGANVISLLQRLVCEADNEANKIAEFEALTSKYRNQKELPQPEGVSEPMTMNLNTKSYLRDPKVKAWVLKNAAGYCESCGCSAPFINANGEPFLEVHHLKRLSEGGSDKVTNTVAVCPNCHRELHFGTFKHEKVNLLYTKLSRLVKE